MVGPNLLSLLIWLIIGGIAGYLASRLMGRPGRYGLVGDIIVGLIGSLVGGFIVQAIGGNASTGLSGLGLIGSIIVATLGAVVFLYLLRLFGSRV